MSLYNVDFIIGTVALVFAYLFSVTIVGSVEAYAALKAGDDTPQEAGMLLFNPLTYIDMVGFMCAVLIGFGWGRAIPFNPNNVIGPRKTWKVLGVYMTQPLASLALALIALIINVFLVGPQSLSFAFWNVLSKNVPLQQLAAVYPQSSSLTLVIVVLLLSLISLNIFIATWSLINNSFHYLLFIGAEHGYDYMNYAEALAFFGPLVVLICFIGPLQLILLNIVTYLAYMIASLCGACV